MPTLTERMIVAAASEIQDGEMVFVGMRLPLLAFALAKRLHAPEAVGLFECGLVRDEPAAAPIVTMADPANVQGAAWAGGMGTLLGLLAQGQVALGLLGGAQVDHFGNLNSSYIGPYHEPTVRLPGSGGASDIASLAGRTVLLMAHEARRFVEEVDYLTSPGHGTGAGWREGVGLPAHARGPATVISTLGVLRADETGELVLASVHPGVTVEAVRAATGWPLRVADSLHETPSPTPEALAILRALMGQAG